MSSFRIAAAVTITLLLMLAPAPARAGETDPLFVNLTTDNGHRARMALAFSENQAARKHPVAIFLNDRGVLIGDKTKAKRDAMRVLEDRWLAELR